jgi:hypothetical protein
VIAIATPGTQVAIKALVRVEFLFDLDNLELCWLPFTYGHEFLPRFMSRVVTQLAQDFIDAINQAY